MFVCFRRYFFFYLLWLGHVLFFKRLSLFNFTLIVIHLTILVFGLTILNLTCSDQQINQVN